MIDVIVSGFVQGVYYALLSLGIVLIYRQSRVLNFAHGSIATFAGYIAYATLSAGAPYWLASSCSIVGGILAALVVEALAVRPLSGESEHTTAIGTIGAGLMIIGGVALAFGTTQVAFPSPIDGKVISFSVGALRIGGHQILAIIVTLALSAIILLVLEFTRLGIALRAASEGALTAEMLGVDTARMRQVVWGASGALAAIAALLIVPDHYLDPNFITDFMISAFVAVVLGGLESIVGVIAGGILFGIASALFSYFCTERLSNSFAFVSILILLLILPHGLFGKSRKQVAEPKIGGRSRISLGFKKGHAVIAPFLTLLTRRGGTWVAILLAVGATLVAPAVIPAPYVYTMATIAGMFVAVTSQNLVTGYSGQFSIGQSGFMVIGAYVAVLMQINLHTPFLISVFAAAILSGVCGLVLGFPAIRLSGIYLALLTMTFALAMPELAAFPDHITGGGMGLQVPPASIMGASISGTWGLYYLAVAVFWIVLVLVYGVTSSPIGRSWLAIRNSELGATSIGINVPRVKVQVFCVGAALAGVSGATTVTLVGYLSPDNYTLWTAVFLLLGIIVGGSASTLGSVFGAVFIVLLPILFAGLPEIPQIAYGAAVLIFLLIAPEGLAAFFVPRQSISRQENAHAGAIGTLVAKRKV
jgi:ABC-type branched-subunit amino acid transport system permease subunit